MWPSGMGNRAFARDIYVSRDVGQFGKKRKCSTEKIFGQEQRVHPA